MPPLFSRFSSFCNVSQEEQEQQPQQQLLNSYRDARGENCCTVHPTKNDAPYRDPISHFFLLFLG